MFNIRKWLQKDLLVFWLIVFLIAIQILINYSGFSLAKFFIFLIISLIIFAVLFAYFYFFKKTQGQIQLEQLQSTSMLEGIADPVVAHDTNFRILFANKAIEELTGLKKDEIIGRQFTPENASDKKLNNFALILFPSLAPAILRRAEETFPQVVEIKVLEPIERVLEITTSPIFDSQGQILGYLKTVRDKTREEVVLRSKTEFITIAAHQLRTPINALRWIFEILNAPETGQLSEQQKKLVNDGLSASGKMLGLVEDLLNIAKIEEGKFEYSFKEMDIESLIEKALMDFKPSADAKKIKLYFYRSKITLPKIQADSVKIYLVLQNLLDNAIIYNNPNGEVRIKVKMLEDRPFIKVSVEDTGIGISEEVQRQIFQRFFRAENAKNINPEGIGLGLFITRNIVKRHGGDIGFYSYPKRGTTFWFTLPIDPSYIPPQGVVYQETL